MDLGNFGIAQAVFHVRLKIEQIMFGAGAVDEIQTVGAILLDKQVVEFRAYFVRALGDSRADSGDDGFAFCAERQHGVERVFNDAAKRAFPTGMGGGDNIMLPIGEQYRHAIGGKYAQGDAGFIGDDSVGLRRIRPVPGVLDWYDVGAMNLVRGAKRRRLNMQRTRNKGAVLRDAGDIVARSVSAIERPVQPRADPAIASEKTMLNAFDLRQSRAGKRNGERTVFLRGVFHAGNITFK